MIYKKICGVCDKVFYCKCQCGYDKKDNNGCYCREHYFKSFGKDEDYFILKEKGCPRFRRLETFIFR